MRNLLPFLLLLLLSACSGNATKVRLINATNFNLEEATLSFGGNEESIGFLRAGDETSYFRFDGADDCDRQFTGSLQSFGEIASGFWICAQPEPLLPGKYSLTIAFEAFTGSDGTTSNEVFLRLREE